MFLNYLNTESAQKIADGIMKIIPYNINIMDNDGIIIASGDKSRINKVHKGALKALQLGEPYVVYEDTDTERKGINIPIYHLEGIVGVIGISGNVEEVMQIGQIVAVTAQLMIENKVYNDMVTIKESRLKDFLHEWICLEKSDYTGKFLDQASYFGVDLNISRIAVIITSRRIRYSVIENIKYQLEPNEYIVRQRMEDVLVLFNYNKNLHKRLEKIINISNDLLNCYVGEPSVIAKDTTEYAMQTFNISQALGINKKIIYFNEVSLESLIYSIEKNMELEKIINIFIEKDKDGILKKTICAYVEQTNNYTEICKHLHIHRNTLNYRLSKIEEVFGKNPKCAKDLMMLYIAIIKMKNQQKHMYYANEQ